MGGRPASGLSGRWQSRMISAVLGSQSCNPVQPRLRHVLTDTQPSGHCARGWGRLPFTGAPETRAVARLGGGPGERTRANPAALRARQADRKPHPNRHLDSRRIPGALGDGWPACRRALALPGRGNTGADEPAWRDRATASGCICAAWTEGRLGFRVSPPGARPPDTPRSFDPGSGNRLVRGPIRTDEPPARCPCR